MRKNDENLLNMLIIFIGKLLTNLEIERLYCYIKKLIIIIIIIALNIKKKFWFASIYCLIFFLYIIKGIFFLFIQINK